jgi:hypothetical protein
MRRRTDYILMLRPWSLSTFMAALLAVAFATTMQELFAEFGARFCFAGFFPAILIGSLVGGAAGGHFCHPAHHPDRLVGIHAALFRIQPTHPGRLRQSFNLPAVEFARGLVLAVLLPGSFRLDKPSLFAP